MLNGIKTNNYFIDEYLIESQANDSIYVVLPVVILVKKEVA
jgi:hypothetical protein